MTTAAWITLVLTWSVIGTFTVRFFLKVVASGRGGARQEGPE